MAELTPLERLQPSLLDRLTDDDPNSRKEPREKRVFSIRRLKESVLRDLTWLLNTTNQGLLLDERSYAEVARSVLNYGIPDLAGTTSTTMNRETMSQEVRNAILNFEPRILTNDLHVNLMISEDQMNQNALTMRIEGELWAVPVPLHLLVDTFIDLDTGSVAIVEGTGSA